MLRSNSLSSFSDVSDLDTTTSVGRSAFDGNVSYQDSVFTNEGEDSADENEFSELDTGVRIVDTVGAILCLYTRRRCQKIVTSNLEVFFSSRGLKVYQGSLGNEGLKQLQNIDLVSINSVVLVLDIRHCWRIFGSELFRRFLGRVDYVGTPILVICIYKEVQVGDIFTRSSLPGGFPSFSEWIPFRADTRRDQEEFKAAVWAKIKHVCTPKISKEDTTRAQALGLRTVVEGNTLSRTSPIRWLERFFQSWITLDGLINVVNSEANIEEETKPKKLSKVTTSGSVASIQNSTSLLDMSALSGEDRDDYTDHVKCRTFVVSGSAGCGKTLFVAKHARQLKTVGAVIHYNYRAGSHCCIRRTVQAISRQMCMNVPDFKVKLYEQLRGEESSPADLIDYYDSDNFPTISKELYRVSSLTDLFEKYIFNVARELNIKSENPRFIYLDGLDQCRKSHMLELLDLLASEKLAKVATWLRFVLTTRPLKEILDKCKVFTLKHFSIDRQNRFIRSHINRRFQCEDIVEEGIHHLASRIELLSEDNLEIADLLLSKLFEEKCKRKVTYLLESEVRDILDSALHFSKSDITKSDLFMRYSNLFDHFKRICTVEKLKYEMIIGFVLAARGPLPISILRNATDLRQEDTLKWLQLVFSCENQAISFIHSSMEEFFHSLQEENRLYVDFSGWEAVLATFTLNNLYYNHILKNITLPDEEKLLYEYFPHLQFEKKVKEYDEELDAPPPAVYSPVHRRNFVNKKVLRKLFKKPKVTNHNKLDRKLIIYAENVKKPGMESSNRAILKRTKASKRPKQNAKSRKGTNSVAIKSPQVSLDSEPIVVPVQKTSKVHETEKDEFKLIAKIVEGEHQQGNATSTKGTRSASVNDLSRNTIKPTKGVDTDLEASGKDKLHLIRDSSNNSVRGRIDRGSYGQAQCLPITESIENCASNCVDKEIAGDASMKEELLEEMTWEERWAKADIKDTDDINVISLKLGGLALTAKKVLDQVKSYCEENFVYHACRSGRLNIVVNVLCDLEFWRFRLYHSCGNTGKWLSDTKRLLWEQEKLGKFAEMRKQFEDYATYNELYQLLGAITLCLEQRLENFEQFQQQLQLRLQSDESKILAEIVAACDENIKWTHWELQGSGIALGGEDMSHQIFIAPNTKGLRCLAHNGSGLFAVGCFSGTVYLSDLTVNREKTVITDLRNTVTSVAFSDDGCYLVAADSKGKIVIKFIKKNKPKATRTFWDPRRQSIFQISFLPGFNNRFLTCSNNGSIKLYCIHSNKPNSSALEYRVLDFCLLELDKGIGAFVVTKDYQLFVGSDDYKVHKFDISFVQNMSRSKLEELAHQDQKRLLRSMVIRNQEPYCLHRSCILCLTVNQSETLVASGSQKKDIFIWYKETLSTKLHIKNQGQEKTYSLKFSSDDESLYAASEQMVRQFALANGEVIRQFDGYYSVVNEIVLMKNIFGEEVLATVSDDQYFRIRNPSRTDPSKSFPGALVGVNSEEGLIMEPPITAVCISTASDGHSSGCYVVTGGDHGIVNVYCEGIEQKLYTKQVHPKCIITKIAISKDNLWVAVIAKRRQGKKKFFLSVWHLRSGERVLTPDTSDTNVISCSFVSYQVDKTSELPLLVYSCSDQTIIFYSLDDEQVLTQYSTKTTVFAMNFHRKSSIMVASQANENPLILSLYKSSDVLRVRTNHLGLTIGSFKQCDSAFSPSGDFFAIATKSKTYCWKFENPNVFQDCKLNLSKNEAKRDKEAKMLCFTTDSQCLVCLLKKTFDVIVWSCQTGVQLTGFKTLSSLYQKSLSGRSFESNTFHALQLEKKKDGNFILPDVASNSRLDMDIPTHSAIGYYVPDANVIIVHSKKDVRMFRLRKGT